MLKFPEVVNSLLIPFFILFTVTLGWQNLSWQEHSLCNFIEFLHTLHVQKSTKHPDFYIFVLSFGRGLLRVHHFYGPSLGSHLSLCAYVLSVDGVKHNRWVTHAVPCFSAMFLANHST